jgi:hypothetical protein
MIDYQSLAIAECLNHRTIIPPLPAGEGRGEGELKHRRRQSALIEVGRAYPRAGLLVHPVNSHNSRKTTQNPQACARLCKHLPPGREGLEYGFPTQRQARCGYLHLFAHFLEKKDCLLLWPWRPWLLAPRYESTQINPLITKYRPFTGLYRPKMNHLPTREAKKLRSRKSYIFAMLFVRFK